jgi:hypothetical protein
MKFKPQPYIKLYGGVVNKHRTKKNLNCVGVYLKIQMPIFGDLQQTYYIRNCYIRDFILIKQILVRLSENKNY